ncbi:HIT domain-containing protein [Rhodobacterales bacterium HKCCSP123]|nr:HIT domain-containing protein [Rhodobacterales bacterium HKCCSP123]
MPNSAFSRLSEYISAKMRMSHIYQPVMIRELLLQGGAASVEEIATALLAHDPSQIEYYALRTKNMVGKVLTKNGITAVKRSGRSITGYELKDAKDLSPKERELLIEACDVAIAAFLNRRGDRIWSHRSMSVGYISGTLRYDVLKRAKFRCELCGISAEDKALEVDHIVPRNHGGTDDEANLQALCYSCNAMKRDRDDADFRGVADKYEDRKEGCVFCELPPDRILSENELAFVIRDAFPVTEGHSLIIPKRHVADYFDLFRPEVNAIQSLLHTTRLDLLGQDPKIAGFNMGVNSGAAAGQTVFHCHVHLFPRRTGDVPEPRGGVRGAVPGKQSY